MDWLRTMHDPDLYSAIRRLKHDVEDFSARAAREASVLKRAGRSTLGDPLHQRLTSIRDHLRDQLEEAQDELARREGVCPKAARLVVSSGARGSPGRARLAYAEAF